MQSFPTLDKTVKHVLVAVHYCKVYIRLKSLKKKFLVFLPKLSPNTNRIPNQIFLEKLVPKYVKKLNKKKQSSQTGVVPDDWEMISCRDHMAHMITNPSQQLESAVKGDINGAGLKLVRLGLTH